ncbi:ferredoxin-dependent bilin reductase [Trichodesmium erythraeum IMS101]|uniref:Phycocyanobilin:ferredoxin oxidoreductase n=1 Tax=Trichodesmium erythraeum (strain IMS101) TaxID=203124 RepID=PCYA_TRIEI|nr:RecName: Full=Phycocyanobilin:ferredoxin oxidoreductase [Trichodesmium erythraeum IMS101]MBS9769955.1 phycocyanobilin:ferredoxin oxidoreductase [Trichodesmium erythraeum GBRTRLIN201]MCH2048874.1 phycocyanobilin:ferredoxin oxidoreductase [Trichodesmium sp. ALOHA_ZT_67]MDE5069291.1 phycocyanobilin:ferredoxin oxidoreductase [Trichodesmium sp. St4_bin8_1]MDE5102343.1 phycocyanobilin:ferredoxin oxidoreductase [Trichodesmium sp. St19_bin2]MDT9339478.1 phycocyanobilin:ferredoxin oxidoreductase [Tr
MLKTSIPSQGIQQNPLVCQLANSIEAVWQRYLNLEPYYLPADLGYVEGRLEGEKLIIQNKCYQTAQFRKLHLELATIGPKLDILHCVMFPRISYPLPIFGTDLVGARGQISAAVVDISPQSQDRKLPEVYNYQLQALPIKEFAHPRQLPQWGEIFSEFCLFIRPTGLEEEQKFISIVESYLEIHCQQAIAQKPVSPEQQLEILKAQHHYCTQQRQNDKTRRVLEKAFGPEWTDYYLTTVLFDSPN